MAGTGTTGSGGGAGNNVLNGGNGHDCIVGDSGNDLIDGGGGNDLIDLGNFSGESDTIVFSDSGGSDTIENFDARIGPAEARRSLRGDFHGPGYRRRHIGRSFTGQSVLLADVHGIALAHLTFV